jgi:cell division transport system permease protein
MTEAAAGPGHGPRRPAHPTRPKRRRRKPGAAKVSASTLVERIGVGAEMRQPVPRTASPLVPPRTVARRTLLALVAIMSFLACISVAAVAMVAERADAWRRQIAEEVTIQIKPADGVDIAAAIARTIEIAESSPGVAATREIDEAEAEALLEPWLGAGFDAGDLPIPRLVAVRLAPNARLQDLGALAERLAEEAPNASLDDHRQWENRLSAMAQVMTLAGTLVLGLVFAATALCVVFATRGAMASNRIVIEVLHFVGAEDSFIAREFQRHFLLLGLRGAGIGGAIAALMFLALTLFGRFEGSTPEEAQLRSLFGGFSVGPLGYLGAAATVLGLAILIAATARFTVRRTLTEIE